MNRSDWKHFSNIASVSKRFFEQTSQSIVDSVDDRCRKIVETIYDAATSARFGSNTAQLTKAHIMKKVMTVLCITCALAVVAQAQDSSKKKHEPTPEMKALLEKYDTNKDGKLDKAEKSKMSAEDKDKLQKGAHAKKKQS